MRQSTWRTALMLAAAMPVATAHAAGLGGSPASMKKQYARAREAGAVFIATPAQVEKRVAEHALVQIVPSENVVLRDVSYPYARPEAALFVARLAQQFRDATGVPLTVTSLTRPESTQPKNAHALSVHPAGLAVDLHIPTDEAQREWLEQTLLSLEKAGVLDVTREKHPPHYHVAIYPTQYSAYVAPLVAKERADSIARAIKPAPVVAAAPAPSIDLGEVVGLGVEGLAMLIAIGTLLHATIASSRWRRAVHA